jgi:hypothetical protein
MSKELTNTNASKIKTFSMLDSGYKCNPKNIKKGIIVKGNFHPNKKKAGIREIRLTRMLKTLFEKNFKNHYPFT